MRILLSFIFLLSASIIFAQRPAETAIAIKKSGKYQFVNKQTGVPVNDMLWDEAENFVNGFAKVLRNKKFSLVDGNGKPIAPVEFDAVNDFSNKLCAVQKDGKWGFIDAWGKLAISLKYDIAFDFTDATVTVVCNDKKWWLINSKGTVIKQLDINFYYGFKNGAAKVSSDDDKEGVLYADGKIVWNQATAKNNNPVNWQPNSTNVAMPCPENIGFELGDLTNWECFTGHTSALGNVNIITVAPSPPVPGRHTVYAKANPSPVDPYGGFKTNPPDNSNFAVKLGNNVIGAEAERIRYSIHVPVNDSIFSVKYDYAVVFEVPEDHEAWTQPRFISRLIDSASGTAIACASLEYVASSGLPGFEHSPVSGVVFKRWSSVFYSLRGYGGKTLYLEFTTADCTKQGHWGYAYVDVQSNTCGSPVVVNYNCVAPNETILTAPPGFQTYNWWSSDFSTLLGTGQQLILNPGPPMGTVIKVEMIPYNSFGCRDTLLAKLNGNIDAAFDMTDPTGCTPKIYTFYNRNLPSVNTTWDFGDGNTATGDTVTHTFTTGGTFHVTMTVTMAGGCTGNAIRLVTIYPSPNMIKPNDVIVCNQTNTNDIIFTGTPPGMTYNWTNNNSSIGLPASGTGPIYSFYTQNPGTTPVTATITVTPTHFGCVGPSQTFTITVNPSPTVVQPNNQLLCNGSTTLPITFTGSLSGTSFVWTNDEPSIGLPTSGSGNIPSFTANNTTNAPVIATIVVTPLNGTCPGNSTTFSIVVYATPSVVPPADQVVCNNVPTGIISFSSPVAGTSFTWTNNNPSMGLAASGSGNIASFTPVNTGLVPITATITVTPKAYICFGPPQSFTITVNPSPGVVQPIDYVACNGVTTNAINFTGTLSATSFTWTNDNTAIGLAASGSGSIPPFTAINTTNVPVIAIITVTPTASGCPGPSTTFTIKVNPTPDVLIPANQTLCNGSATTAIAFTGTISGSNFTWANDNASIGLPASGVGDIPSFTAINTTNVPVTATITITPFINSCAGIAQSFTITIKPSPYIVKPADQVLCNNATTTTVGFASTLSGASYTWTNDNISIGLAANGLGDISSFTAINTTNTAATANIIATAFANGCTGPPQNFTIIVNPIPDVVQPTGQRVCNQVKSIAVIFSGAVTGTSFNWTNNNPSIGLAANGTGNIGAFFANNASSSPVSATIIVTPIAKGCIGSPKTTIISVDPGPIADLGTDLFLSTGTITTLNATIQNGPIINWTWSPAKDLSCTNCPSPQLKVTGDINYSVAVTNAYGCIGRDNISISTFCKNSQVFVPAAFTPDGDGLNDVLMVRGTGIFVTSFRIFNRWGEVVFQKTNFNPNDKQYGWDGKVKGISANADVFIFTAEVVCDNGVKYTYKGNTTLLK